MVVCGAAGKRRRAYSLRRKTAAAPIGCGSFCLRKASKAGAWSPGRQAKYAGNMEEGMKKRIVSLVLALVLVLGLLPGPVMAAWPSFRGNGSNMGITDVQTPAPDYAKLQWAAKIGTSAESMTTSTVYAGQPVVEGEFVYATAGRTLYKIKALDGSVAVQQVMDGRTVSARSRRRSPGTRSMWRWTAAWSRHSTRIRSRRNGRLAGFPPEGRTAARFWCPKAGSTRDFMIRRPAHRTMSA